MTDLEDVYDLPRGFTLARAAHGERVEPTDADVELVVLESALTGEKTLVHADVVDYSGRLDHPVTTGVAGFLGVLLAFLFPLAALPYLTVGLEAIGLGAWASLSAVAVAVIGAYVFVQLAYASVLGDWLHRFLEWNDNKKYIMARGETA